MVYDKMEKRNKRVDVLTLKWCRDFQANLLRTLRSYYTTRLSPAAVDFMEPRLFYGDGYQHLTIVCDVESGDIVPCSYSVHPANPYAVVPTVLARAGVEHYKWSILRSEYPVFYHTMEKTTAIKDELVYEANKHACVRACHAFKEELVARVFHPKNLERWMEQGIEDMMCGL